MCLQVNPLQRRERSNRPASKGRRLDTFYSLCLTLSRALARFRSGSLSLLTLSVSVIVIACEPTTPTPPVQINSDAGSAHRPAQPPPRRRQRHVASASQIMVRAMLLAERVTRQLPRKVNTRFSSTSGYIWGWLELSNLGPETELLLRWERQGEVRGEFSFTASNAPKMRTWTRLMLRPDDVGEWSLSLLEARDRSLIQRAHFEVYSAESSDKQMPYVSLLNAKESAPLKTRADALSLNQLSAKLSNSAEDEGPLDVSQDEQAEPDPLEPPTEPGVSEVRRLVVSTSIKHRRPIGVSDRFPGDVDRLWGYVEVRHSGPPSLLLMEWWREGDLRSRLKVRVGESLRWRTWSWQRLRPQRDAGHWTLKVLSPDKKLLSETPFYVESL